MGAGCREAVPPLCPTEVWYCELEEDRVGIRYFFPICLSVSHCGIFLNNHCFPRLRCELMLCKISLLPQKGAKGKQLAFLSFGYREQVTTVNFQSTSCHQNPPTFPSSRPVKGLHAVSSFPIPTAVLPIDEQQSPQLDQPEGEGRTLCLLIHLHRWRQEVLFSF